MAPVKAHEIRSKNRADLESQLGELKQELSNLKVQKVSGGSSGKLTKITSIRRSIARVYTVINQKQREAVRQHYKEKTRSTGSRALIPLDLRPKKTRALRRKLTTHQAKKVTLREHKKRIHFPTRKYAVKA